MRFGSSDPGRSSDGRAKRSLKRRFWQASAGFRESRANQAIGSRANGKSAMREALRHVSNHIQGHTETVD
jgi:hypothetical protein